MTYDLPLERISELALAELENKALKQELAAARLVVEAARYMSCQDHKGRKGCCYCDVDKALEAYDKVRGKEPET